MIKFASRWFEWYQHDPLLFWMVGALLATLVGAYGQSSRERLREQARLAAEARQQAARERAAEEALRAEEARREAARAAEEARRRREADDRARRLAEEAQQREAEARRQQELNRQQELRRAVELALLEGKRALHEQQFDAAVAHFTRAIRLDANHAEAYVWRAAGHLAGNRRHEAQADAQRAGELYGRALQRSPNDSDLWLMRGFAWHVLGICESMDFKLTGGYCRRYCGWAVDDYRNAVDAAGGNNDLAQRLAAHAHAVGNKRRAPTRDLYRELLP